MIKCIHSVRIQLHYSKITACVLHGSIPIPLSFVPGFASIPNFGQTAIPILTAFQSTKNKLLCSSQDKGLLGYYGQNWSGMKFLKGLFL